MPSHRLQGSLPTLRAVASASVLAAAAVAAHAETSPYYFGVSQSLTHTSNLTREPDTEPKNSSTVSSTALIGGIDQPFGRQRLRANATLKANRYSDNSQFNNNGYELRAGLDWATIERISGELNINASRDLGGFDVLDPATNRILRVRNLEKVLDTSFVARVGVVTALTLEASVAHREFDNSAIEYEFRNYKQDAVSAGFRYRQSGALTWGAALRHTKLKYPTYRNIDATPGREPDEVKRNDLDLTAGFAPGGASSFNARVSVTRWTHSQSDLAAPFDVLNLPDYSGVTGALTWNWAPTGKIRVDTTLSRESGAESRFTTTNVRQDDSLITNALQVRANYEVSAKINATATGRYVERKLPDLGLSTDRKDRIYLASLGVRWTPIRPLTVGCDLSKEQRTASVADTNTWPYHVNTFGCSGQFVFN